MVKLFKTHREGGWSHHSGPGSVLNTLGSNLGIRTWVSEKAPSREQWVRVPRRSPGVCHSQLRGVVRSREVKGFSQSSMLTLSSGIEDGFWRGESGSTRLTDE